jgi:hypothetical protein
MLEHYSHIRLNAKRNALEALEQQRERERERRQNKQHAESSH